MHLAILDRFAHVGGVFQKSARMPSCMYHTDIIITIISYIMFVVRFAAAEAICGCMLVHMHEGPME